MLPTDKPFDDNPAPARDPLDDFQLIAPGPDSPPPAPEPRRRPKPEPDDFDPEPPRSGRRKWLVGIAIAAGFVAVACAVGYAVVSYSSFIREPGHGPVIEAPRRADLAKPFVLGDGDLRKVVPPDLTPPSPAVPLKYVGKPLTYFDFPENEVLASCVAGRGRFLFVALGRTRELHVIDLTTGATMRVLSLGETRATEVRLFGGADVVVAEIPEVRKLVAWPLQNLNTPIKVRLQDVSEMGMPVMGGDTNGPLVFVRTGYDRVRSVSFLDPMNFQALRYEFADAGSRKAFETQTPGATNASGAVLANVPRDSKDPPVFWRIEGDKVTEVVGGRRPPNSFPMTISADGGTAATPLGAWKIDSGAAVPGFPRDPGGWPPAFVIGSADPGFVTVRHADRNPKVELWRIGQAAPVARLDDDAEALALYASGPGPGKTFDYREVHYVRESNVAVLVGPKKVVIWHADPARQEPKGRAAPGD